MQGPGKVDIIPIDSERSAIFQCLQAMNQGLKNNADGQEGLFAITARKAGRGFPEQALKHPIECGGQDYRRFSHYDEQGFGSFRLTGCFLCPNFHRGAGASPERSSFLD